MGEVKLNLARKWRSKNFEEIIGQDLAIRMLKNGLYLQQYFPVYLFSGQRGCGKTSTARIFGAALNCEQLTQFQEQPQKQPIPCLSCVSCKAMEQGRHPDFIEIDAASHTGVDNVRVLIDSASLLPLMGRKKIYLIDEAHMLSKAAFNALLKILEEPPTSVLFILATTDPQKIIETVRSRCFQLFFKPVETGTLQARLRTICEREKILYDDAGLSAIVKQTEGSVRDALNVLEQVRFSSNSVTYEAVLRALGHIEDQKLITLFSFSMAGSPQQLLRAIAQMEWKKFSAPIMWSRLLELVHTALWLRHDITPTEFVNYHDAIKEIVRSCSVRQLSLFLQTMYDQELLFAKTTAKHDFLEMVLLQICQSMKKGDSNGGLPSAALQAPVAVETVEDESEEDEGDDEESTEDEEEEEGLRATPWQQAVKKIEQLDEPLITSIFVQGVFKKFDEQTGIVEVEFSQEVSFFNAWLNDTKTVWQPVLQDVFGEKATLTPLFTGAPLPKKQKAAGEKFEPSKKLQPTRSPQPQTEIKKEVGPRRVYGRQTQDSYKPFAQEQSIDISDKEVWQKTHLVMSHIPGTIKEIRG